MSVTFNPRRKARLVGRSNDDEDDQGSIQGPAVKRPGKSKQRSKVSFGPTGTSMVDGEEEEEVTVVKPRRNLPQRTLDNNTLRNAQPRPLDENLEGLNHAEEGARPAYSRAHIDELRSAHRSKPDSSDEDHASTAFSRELAIADKFGDISRYQHTHEANVIPTDMEIQAKKARRAHLAKLAEYKINPDDSEDDGEQDDLPNSDEDEFLTQRDKILLRDTRTASKKEIDTRLLPDDQDLMEGFDDFTNESGRVPLGSDAQAAMEKKRRTEIREMLNAAHEEENDDEDASDQDQRDQYEKVQTQKGIKGSKLSARNTEDDGGARTPPRITPIPSLGECVKRLRDQLLEAEASRKSKLQRLEELATERKEVMQRETEIQRLLKETSEKYEKLSAEVGHVEPLLLEGQAAGQLSGRGLESIAVNTD